MFGLLLHMGIELRSLIHPLEMAIQSAVACPEVKDGGMLVSWQLMEWILVGAVSSSCCGRWLSLYYGEEFGLLHSTDVMGVFFLPSGW